MSEDREVLSLAERDLVRALVDALPDCDVCGATALLVIEAIGGRPRRCDAHHATGHGACALRMVDAAYAPALRALLSRMATWTPVEQVAANDGGRGE